MTILDKQLQDYIMEFSDSEDDILKELDRETHLRTVQPRMLSGHIQGKILQMFVRMCNPKNILEIGTFTGYSAICMAKVSGEDCLLYTIDINDELEYLSSSFIRKAGVDNKIKYYCGSALDVVPQIGECFDLVFMDGDKREYVEYYNMLMDNNFVRSGSIILADNVLWDGKVIDESSKTLKDSYTNGIKSFNAKVRADDRVDVVIMPFRDGMSIIYVK